MINDLALVFENKEKELRNIKNYILNIDKYETRVFYLSVCNLEVMNEIRLLFKSKDYQIVKQSIIDKILPYFAKVVFEFNEQWQLKNIEDDIHLKFIVQDKEKNTLLIIDSENKKVEVVLPENIKTQLDIGIPYEISRKKALLREKDRLISTLNEQTITKPSDYTKKLLMPKRHERQVNGQMQEIDNLIGEIDKHITSINILCQDYLDSKTHQKRLQLAKELEKYIQLKN